MKPGACASAPTVRDWGKGFDWYLSSADTNVDRSLVVEARDLYTTLCDSQASPRLLHGDFHHYNVLWDAARGWVAIDPKGVIGEVEYEAGAALRNPFETPELLVDPARIMRRVDGFARRLRLDPNRLLAWGFAQAVLSAVWLVEDGLPVDGAHSSIRLARAMRPMLTDRDYG
jgi:streptomycin 6-kinase